MSAYTGFQFGHPESVLPSSTAGEPSLRMRFWGVLQQTLAGCALVVLSPVFLLMWVLVRLGSPGPFLFTQQRPGLHGVPFKIYKVRTLRPNSEQRTALGVTNAAAEVTRTGKILRALKLDELPQLWNVARGEMALVGPRPIPMALDRELQDKIPGFEMRYEVPPGLTSMGQICVHDNAIGDALVADWKLRFEGELHYLRHRSIRYDLLMMFMTGVFIGRKLVSSRDRKPARASGDTVALLEVPIAVGGYREVVDKIIPWGMAHEHRMVGVCNVHSVTSAGWMPELRKALLAADLNTADGMPLVWMQRLLGHRTAQRVYGPTLMLETLRRAEPLGLRVAFYGGHPERLPILLERLRSRFPRLVVVEAISPPFRELSETEEAEYTRRLRDARPQLIWVGLGCPKQERWMHAHREKIPGVMLGVGAAFDFHAGAVAQAPAVLQRLGLEWAFRLWQEPRRLFRRYLTTNPIFLGRATLQLVRHALAALLPRRKAAVQPIFTSFDSKA